MKRRTRLVAGALLALAVLVAAGYLLLRRTTGLAFVTYPESEVASVRNIHLYKGKPLCQACHAGETRRLRDDPIPLCARCHGFRGHNHPVGVAQKGIVPEDLPLGAGGIIVCHTCHDQHFTTAGTAAAAAQGKPTSLMSPRSGLRLSFNVLCIRCHRSH